MVDESQFDTLRREMRVLIEGVHDHIRLVAEASAGQSEATNRRLDALEVKVDRLSEDNLAQHRTLLSVLGDHENRIAALERETN
jgi:hypothetical protein